MTNERVEVLPVSEAADAIFNVIWPMQDWDGEASVCRNAATAAAEAVLARLSSQSLPVEVREALAVMIYETTSLSPMEDDGSHWCRISAAALDKARAALKANPGGGEK